MWLRALRNCDARVRDSGGCSQMSVIGSDARSWCDWWQGNVTGSVGTPFCFCLVGVAVGLGGNVGILNCNLKCDSA